MGKCVVANRTIKILKSNKVKPHKAIIATQRRIAFRRAHILRMIRQRTSPLVGVIVTGVDIVTIDVDVSEKDTRLQEPSLGRLRE